jgi:hypothetical protein
LKTKTDIYLKITDIVSDMEKKIDVYKLGVLRNKILVMVDPKPSPVRRTYAATGLVLDCPRPGLYSRIIRGLLGSQILIKEGLEFLQSERIQPAMMLVFLLTVILRLIIKF